ncbi:hypothetical protein [Bacillus sp. ME78]|uniref:hypothetical protein n=1 Tax=Bacillus sp. ME78 TaxID=2744261 RepID=UPI00160292BB|nr:hypothetical protein [Bacillus sp. ME78]MED2488264.1 hypothetical protein [Bacillus thuringiensis]
MINNTQRNKYDVIMELLNTHLELARSEGTHVSAEELEELFRKYYHVVAKVQREA